VNLKNELVLFAASAFIRCDYRNDCNIFIKSYLSAFSNLTYGTVQQPSIT